MQLRVFVLSLLLLPSLAHAGGSPYTLRWSVDGPLAGGGLGSGLAAIALRSSAVPLTQEEVAALSADNVNAFDRAATEKHSAGAAMASDVLVVALIASPLLLLGDGDIRADAGTVGVMYAEVMGLALAVPQVVKEVTGRVRPYVYNPDAPMEEKLVVEAKRSFFSQHATFAFSSAVFLSTVYADFNPDSRWTPYVWGGSLVLAGVTSWLRVEAGQHFPTDVLAGAVVGAAIGWLVPALHRTGDAEWSSTAAPQPGGIAVAIRYTF
jgi:membrane-associated phospholipid phosphatase